VPGTFFRFVFFTTEDTEGNTEGKK